VVAAAGNDGRDNSLHTSGYGTINAPGNDPYVITVGAMKTMDTPSRSDDQIASYSSKGPTLIDHIVKPDLVAPGNRIVSLRSPDGALDVAYPQNLISFSAYTRSANNRPSPFYFQLSGTSMSTAMVSGAAALLVEKEPSLTPDQVKARLMKSASKTFPAVSLATDPITGAVYRSEYDIFTVGAGYLDVWAALNGDDPPSGSAKSPTANYDALTGSATVLSDSWLVWGSSPSWSTSVVWGDNVFVNYSSVVWGDAVVWGDITSQGFSVIWGTSVVWGDALVGVPASASPVDVLIQGEP
jgi:serine protease AprX